MSSKNFTVSALEFLEMSMRWADPSWWIWTSVLLFCLCTIHFFPLELKEAENHNFFDRVLVFARKIMMITLLGLAVVMPIVLACLFAGVVPGEKHAGIILYINWVKEMTKSYWTLPIAAIIAGVTINLCWHRYGEPYLSNLRRSWRVNQDDEKFSDVRDEIENYESRRFDPEPYFKDGFYFVGLDLNNRPIYIDADLFESTNTGKFAPTRFGKGVSAGVILTQAIRRGNATWMIDPKGDKRLPYILQEEAKRAGKPFVYLDLNPQGKGTWEPFKGGPLRDRRARIMSAFGLEAGGTNADVYKSKERSTVDKVLQTTDGTLRAMQTAVNALLDSDALSQLRDGLNEWAQISTFMSNRKKKGHSIEASLLNGAVVYVRGSITDAVVKKATRAYITELMQEAQRLHSQRTSHLTTFADEVRFIMSQQLVDALATGLEFETNLILATQAVTDLENLEDKTIDAKALRSSFEINCQIKFIYKAGDVDTAVWGEELSGVKVITIARNEKAKVNRYGGEKWEDTRAFDKQEVPLINRNVLLSLPPMVSVLYMPGSLAQVVFSSWMTVDQSNCTWEKKDKDEEVELDDTPGSGPVPVAAAVAVVTSAVATSPKAVEARAVVDSLKPKKATMRPNPKLAAASAGATFPLNLGQVQRQANQVDPVALPLTSVQETVVVVLNEGMQNSDVSPESDTPVPRHATAASDRVEPVLIDYHMPLVPKLESQLVEPVPNQKTQAAIEDPLVVVEPPPLYLHAIRTEF